LKAGVANVVLVSLAGDVVRVHAVMGDTHGTEAR
jgi:hypothetical protein